MFKKTEPVKITNSRLLIIKKMLKDHEYHAVFNLLRILMLDSEVNDFIEFKNLKQILIKSHLFIIKLDLGFSLVIPYEVKNG